MEMEETSTSKKRKYDDMDDQRKNSILDELIVTDPVPAEEETEPLDFNEVVDINYKKCYACECINNDAMRENEHFMALMKLYTDNATSTCKDAIFSQIKLYFDKNIKPEHESLEDETETIEWSLECIREHFLSHTQFPTDEILTQLRLKKALRNHLANNMVERKADGTMKFDIVNIKLATALDKEILTLLKARKEIPSMVGYSEVLDF